MKRILISALCLTLPLVGAELEFEQFTKPLLEQHCYKCHGRDKTKGKVNLFELETRKKLLAKPDIIKEVIEALDALDMPPEEEPRLKEADRTKLIKAFKEMLKESAQASTSAEKPLPIRRLNRFQYNNAIRDLFQIQRDIFPLTEKLMTRQTPYLESPEKGMPLSLQVHSTVIEARTKGGFRGVKPFPKDLRAAHGFDNQANQLTLSPLLLDAFLRLSVSIVESPDFNPDNVGIWKEIFAEPSEKKNLEVEFKERIGPFLEQAFRGPVDEATLNRYTKYAESKVMGGLSFTETMKKVASAALSSPLFLYIYSPESERASRDWVLASKLSFFLWNSIPDKALIELARTGKLSDPETLQLTVERMLVDPKIEGFLDTFPAQWMQLENAISVNPDPTLYPHFSIDQNYPASLQMVMEPLLLFDTVFLDDLPLIQLISPSFTYQSEFLNTWYNSDLQPKSIDKQKLEAENEKLTIEKDALKKKLQKAEDELTVLTQPVKEKILADRKLLEGKSGTLNLKPIASWEFNGDLESTPDTNPPMNLKAVGDIDFQDGWVILDKAYLESPKLNIELKAKTLEVWCELPTLAQRGGGVMTVQGPGGLFDSVVYGERRQMEWISGSNNHLRTQDFVGAFAEVNPYEVLHLAMVYEEDGTTTLYRNGVHYGDSYSKGSASFPKDKSSVLFGLRHLPAGGNKYMQVNIDKARLYNRALTLDEVIASGSGTNSFVSQDEILGALSTEQATKFRELIHTIRQTGKILEELPKPIDLEELNKKEKEKFDSLIRSQLLNRKFTRVKLTDPRYGGVLTNAALLSMTSGPNRTHPIARGAWIVEVLFNDPPPPPPNDVPPLKDDPAFAKLTIREQFAQHREHPDCAGCHQKLDPLGFALENFDITGRWRDKYKNGRSVDSTGILLRKYPFSGIVQFKESLVKEEKRFARAFTAHLLRYAVSRELVPSDTLVVESIVEKSKDEGYAVKALIREVIQSKTFLKN